MKDRYHLLPIAAAVVIAAGIAVSFFTIDAMTWKSAELRAESVLFDSAQAQASAFCAVTDGQYRLLSMLSGRIAAHAGDDTDSIKRMLAEMSTGSGFSTIRFIDRSGKMFTDDGTVDVSDRGYFKTAMNGQRGIQLLNVEKLQKQAVALCVPYLVRHECGGVICGWMDEADMRKLLASEAYGGAGYSLLINSKGGVIISAESEYELSNDDSLEFMKDAAFENGVTYDIIMEKLKNGESFTFSFTHDGYRRIAAAVKLGGGSIPENDWFIVNAVSDKFLAGEIKNERRVFYSQIHLLCAFGITAIVLVALYIRANRRRERLAAEDVRQREECFRIVAEQTGCFVFRYDIPSKTYYQVTESEKRFGVPKIMPDFVEDVVRRGITADESVQVFRSFFGEIDAGITPKETDIRLNVRNGAQPWFRFKASLIFSSDGKPQSAVVSYAECSRQREREMAYSRWLQEMSIISKENRVLLEWNLTKDIFENEMGASQKPVNFENVDSFDQNARKFAEDFLVSEDRYEYLSLMNRQRLIGMYHSGIYSASMDFREKNGDSYHWMNLSIRMVMYPASSDIKAYFTVSDIDKEKRAELSKAAQSELDSLTGVCNRGTFVEKVAALLSGSSRQSGSHALIMLDVDEFKMVNDTFGHDAGDRLLQCIAQSAREMLRPEDIIGRIGGDEFMICLTNISSESAMQRRVGEIIGAMKLRSGNGSPVTVSMGVAVFPRDGDSFDTLYKKADIALYSIKKAGKNSFCFYNDGMEETKSALTQIDD